MQYRSFKIFLIIILLPMVFSCTQKPVDVVIHDVSPASKRSNVVRNPYKVIAKRNDTLYKIAKNYNVEIRNLIEINKLSPPYKLITGQVIKLPNPRFHTVTKNDTLYSISRSYDVDISRLAHKNRIQPPYKILPGQNLFLPSSAVTESIAIARIDDDDDTAPTLSVSREVASTQLVPAYKPTQRGFQYKSEKEFGSSFKGSNKNIPVVRLKPGSHRKFARKTGTLPKKNRFVWPVKGTIVSGFGAKKGGLYNDGINISAKAGTPIRSAEAGNIVYAGNELRGYGNMVLIKHSNGYLTAYAHNSRTTVQKGDFVSKGQLIGYVGNTGHVSAPQLHFSIRKGRKAINPEKYL